MQSILEIPNIRQRARLLTVKEYHVLGELGYLPQKTELIEGVVVPKMPKSPRHAFLVKKLYQFFTKVLASTFHVASEQPITLFRSEPEPDISIIFGAIEDYSSSHPTRAELVIEISLTTLQEDKAMADVYAEANIPEYWLFNLNNNTVAVYTLPQNGTYTSMKILSGSAILTPLFQPEIQIELSNLLA